MSTIEYEVATKRIDSHGERVVETRTFDNLDAAQFFVTKTPIEVPPEDQERKWVRYSRSIRRTKEPAQ